MTDETNTFTAAVEQKMAERKAGEEQAKQTASLASRRRREQQSAKVQALYAGLEKATKIEEVELPMMTKALGESYTVKIRDVSPDELFSSNLFPPTAARLIEEMRRDSEAVTSAARASVGMQDIVSEIAEETFENPQMAVVIATQEIEDVFTCVCVADPDVRFVMHEHEAGGNKVWIRKLRREDIRAIANAVWKNVETDADPAVPFPTSGDTGQPAQPSEEVVATAERSDSV